MESPHDERGLRAANAASLPERSPAPGRRHRAPYVYLHRCPVCQLFRAARRLKSRLAPRRLRRLRARMQRPLLVTKRTAPSCFDATLPA
jgi:hypothetical protein